ncbi:MAG: radical SAM protein [Saprospiraceae bacterium]|nr:radical SAM protein [Saprospiraceae bacterium]
MTDVVLITPPFTQLNTPYPATPYLKGFLNTKGISAFQLDLGIDVILSVFSKSGLIKLFSKVNSDSLSPNSKRIWQLKNEYINSIDEVILFLQGSNESLARIICTEMYLPQAKRFEQVNDMDWAFGQMGIIDKAKYFSTLYLEDLSDFIKENIDSDFGFSRYAEKIGQSAHTFDKLFEKLNGANTYIDDIALEILSKKINENNPKLVCFSVPFPGNLYSAFKCAQFIKSNFPSIKTAMGGGFANTELRSISDKRVFTFFDFISLDDGELPIELIYNNVLNPTPSNSDYNLLKRTFVLENNEVVYNNFSLRSDYKQDNLGTPDYSDIDLQKYLAIVEMVNPMHSLWTDGKWLKLTMAHGCYWGKCTFCDTSLDYIQSYEPITASILVNRMEEMIQQTGYKGFHFVDEAAPPALMRALAIEILKRELKVTWWTNIRFEKNFSLDLCRLLQKSGCIAVSGGLEVASDRLLELIDKGVTVEQVAQVTNNFTQAGIMVHAYLMYGYPTQTIQETIDSLEMVRQLFECGVINSGFWHQFALTAHSPIGKQPELYGVTPMLVPHSFAHNDIDFEDETGIDHSQFSFGLKKSIYNFMHDQCFDFPLQEWFDFEIPETTVDKDFIANAVQKDDRINYKNSSKVIWIGQNIDYQISDSIAILNLINKKESFELAVSKEKGNWLQWLIKESHYLNAEILTVSEIKKSYETKFDDFEEFWNSETMAIIRNYGLLIL